MLKEVSLSFENPLMIIGTQITVTIWCIYYLVMISTDLPEDFLGSGIRFLWILSDFNVVY